MVDVQIPVANVMSQALCSRMESWGDKTFQRSILVVGVGRSAHRSHFDDPCYCLVLLRRKPESGPIVSAWVTLKLYVSARRRYVRFGFGRNNYCDCSDCVARPSQMIRLGVQRSWSGVGPVAVP